MTEADFKLDNRIVAMRAFETMDTLLKITDEIKQLNPTNLKISVSSPDSNYNYVRTHHMFSRVLYFLLAFKPEGLEVQNSRCLSTEFASKMTVV